MNKTILIGRVGQDPESRFTPSGAQITNFTLATSQRWTDKNTGEKKESTQWHNIVTFGQTAKIAGDYVKKGSQLAVEGSIEYQSWEKDGEKKYKTVINASNINLLGSKKDQAEPSNQPHEQASSNQQRESYDDFDDDIPF